MRRVMLVTLDSPGCARESMAFLLVRGLAGPGRSRTKKADMRILNKKAATAWSSRSGEAVTVPSKSGAGTTDRTDRPGEAEGSARRISHL